MKYRKKPVVIEAIQFNGSNALEIINWAFGNIAFGSDPERKTLRIETLEGMMTASENDYIIKGIKGEFYPCKPDIFEKTYEKVDSVGEEMIKGRLKQ